MKPWNGRDSISTLFAQDMDERNRQRGDGEVYRAMSRWLENETQEGGGVDEWKAPQTPQEWEAAYKKGLLLEQEDLEKK